MSNGGDLINIKIDGQELSMATDQAVRQGVVIGKDFLDREQFGNWFRKLVKDLNSDNKRLAAFAEKLKNSISTIDKNGKQLSVFRKELNNLHQEFVAFTSAYGLNNGGLGGDIELLTIFQFGTEEQQIYHLAKEDQLDSKIKEKTGGKVLYNSQKSLQKLIGQVDNAILLEEAFNDHLNQFKEDLTNPLKEPLDRQPLHSWAWYNMEKRYEVFHSEKNQDNSGVSLAEYFWGAGQQHGYIAEAFGTHMGLLHKDFKHPGAISVINELGGKTSNYLYMILGATKGNTKSQVSGDIVIIDGNGNIQFNIQSKASKGTNYNINITYQQFLTDVQEFIRIFQNWKSDTEQEKSLDTLFKKFSTTAFIDIKEKLSVKLAEELKKQT